MDIDYLLLLQQFRENTHNFLTPFLEHLSLFAITFLIMIPVFIYWTIDKKKGLYMLASLYLCLSLNAMLKLTACVYRPWIRDARIIPAGDAIRTATGYSFPSGHTAMAGPIYGGLAVTYWAKCKVFAIVCLVLLLLTGFSRNYLGVHTPQDVLVGLIESALVLFVMAKIFSYIEKHPEKENLFLLASFIIGWLGIVYITFKPYPMNYVDGKLLVDPQKMMNDGYGDICLLIAFPVARFIEKKWIGFKPAGLKMSGLLAGIFGLVPLFFMIKFLGKPLDRVMGSHWGHFTYTFIAVLYCIALYPLAIKAASRFFRKDDCAPEQES